LKSTGWIEGTAILITVIIVASVTAGNNWSKEQKFRSLSQVLDTDKKIKVIRENNCQQVLGDKFHFYDVEVSQLRNLWLGILFNLKLEIIFLQICCIYMDKVVLWEFRAYLLLDLSVDESSMTGETENVSKSETDPWLLANTMVLDYLETDST
jgi:hypothetical protein